MKVSCCRPQRTRPWGCSATVILPRRPVARHHWRRLGRAGFQFLRV